MDHSLPDILIKQLNHFSPLGDTDIEALYDRMTSLDIAKGEYWLREGQVSSHIGFLISGVMRVYHLANDKEYTSYFNFGQRNPFVSSFTSFTKRIASQENIHAITDCSMIVISHADLEHLYETHPAIDRLGRKMAEYNYMLALERIYSLQHRSAAERYNELLSIYPQLVNMVPHHYIASYLGITPESLSRIRKEK